VNLSRALTRAQDVIEDIVEELFDVAHSLNRLLRAVRTDWDAFKIDGIVVVDFTHGGRC
jgi:hypothetical protein